uniref:Ycf20-like protein n=1 Tax=Anthurium amnicola TaxID=1678845 RepID=A0A1D1XKZ3_9ARAE
MGMITAQTTLLIMDNEFLERLNAAHRACCSMQISEVNMNFGLQFGGFGFRHAFVRKLSYRKRKFGWRIAFALDTGGTPDNGGQEGLNGDGPGLGRTRLGTIVRAVGKQLLERLNGARKNFPMKIFLLLLGFYTANALATILGQTGDWDVLVAGVVVAAIEGIGMLMYKRSTSMRTGRFQSLVEMVNFWKAGVCLGLFVDAFKLGS